MRATSSPARLLVGHLLVLLVVTACGTTDRPATDGASASAPADEQALVTRAFAAARQGDRGTWDADVSAEPGLDDLFANLSELPLAQLDVRLTGRVTDDRSSDARTLAATATWRLAGERAAAQHRLRVTVAGAGTATRLAGVAGTTGPDARQPIWLQGRVDAHSEPGLTLVLGAGQHISTWLPPARAARAAVRAQLPGPLRRSARSGPVVLEVPATPADFAAVVGGQPADDAGTAAISLPEGPSPDAAVRVIANPQGARLPAEQTVLTLTHELVHVATASPSSPAPLWAVEGLAEEVALAGRTTAEQAAEDLLARTVRERGLPDRLPVDTAFAGSDAALAYGQAWWACRTIAREWSRDALGRFYARLDQGATVQTAAREVLGTSEQELVRRWRSGLAGLADR